MRREKAGKSFALPFVQLTMSFLSSSLRTFENISIPRTDLAYDNTNDTKNAFEYESTCSFDGSFLVTKLLSTKELLLFFIFTE